MIHPSTVEDIFIIALFDYLHNARSCFTRIHLGDGSTPNGCSWTWNMVLMLTIAFLGNGCISRNDQLERKALKIKNGMTMTQATSILGKPSYTDKSSTIEINFGPLDGKKFPNPNIAYIYYGEIDYQICVIFDNANNVMLVTHGGT